MFRFQTQAWGSCVEQEIATLRCVPILLNNVISALITFAGIISLFLIAWAGIKYITSQGDANKLESARKTLTYAIAGLVFIFLSFLLLMLIGQITGVQQLPH